MRRVAGAPRQLVVDLLLVEDGRLAEQRAGHLDDAPGAQQVAQPRVHGHEVLAAAELRPAVGGLPVLEHAGRVGEAGDLVDPCGQLGHRRRADRVDDCPAVLREVADGVVEVACGHVMTVLMATVALRAKPVRSRHR